VFAKYLTAKGGKCMRKPKLVLFAAFVMAGLVLMVGCKNKTAPTVVISTVAPDTIVSVGDTVSFDAEVTNPDNEAITLTWTATGGTFVSDTSEHVLWVTPADSGHFRVSVIVSGQGSAAKDTASKTILVRTWVHSLAEVDNNNTIDIPTPGTAISADTFPDPDGDAVPAGAIVDSVVAYNVDITFGSGSPDSTPAMNVWIQGPDDSTQIQIWNQDEGQFPPNGVSFGPWGMFRGKPVAGVWKLIVTTTEAAPIAGAIEDFDLVVYFRSPGP
jgi:hypothetical protein